MLVYNPQFQLWIGERFGSDTWQFPQGGVGKKGSLVKSVRRELREELGLEDKDVGRITQLEATHRYDFQRTPARWAGRWRGQEQTFWAIEFVGFDDDIDLRSHHPQEFARWAWCPPEEVLDRVEPIRRAGYEAPVREFLTKIVNR